MARVTPGGLISDARGAQGLIVFARNRGGLYTRARVTPANPSSTLQQTTRSHIRDIARAWSGTINESQREQWRTMATRLTTHPKLKRPTPLSGFELFIKVNRTALAAGASLRTTPNSPFETVSILSIAITAQVSTTTLTVFAPASGSLPGQQAFVQAGPILPAGRTSNSGTWSTALNSFILPGTSPNMWTTYTTRFGLPSAGQRIFIRMRGWVNSTYLPSAYTTATTTWSA